LRAGLRLDRRHDRRPAGIGDTEHADASVVALHVLEQPVDRVVGIGALVQRLRVARRARRALHHERAFGSELAADVGEHEDVALVCQRLEVHVEGVGRVRDAVRRPRHDDRQRLPLILRDKHLRVQAHAVARRNHHITDVEPIGGRGLRVNLRRRGATAGRSAQRQTASLMFGAPPRVSFDSTLAGNSTAAGGDGDPPNSPRQRAATSPAPPRRRPSRLGAAGRTRWRP